MNDQSVILDNIVRERIGNGKIIEAAAGLFAQKGFHQTSVDQIAKAAGVSKGLMYNYFASKEELLLAILSAATTEMEVVSDIGTTPANYRQDLRAFIDAYLAMLESRQEFLAFQLTLLLQPGLRDLVAPLLQVRVDMLISRMCRFFEAAGVPNSNAVAARFITELDGIAIHKFAAINSFDARQMLDQLYENYKDLGCD